ncbi:MAG: hypothetical protein M1820_008243 [Bogoriella megaspora]|nr:MAG: hypothetical protein M1820_008243 [Bogoriella megaspora]
MSQFDPQTVRWTHQPFAILPVSYSGSQDLHPPFDPPPVEVGRDKHAVVPNLDERPAPTSAASHLFPVRPDPPNRNQIQKSILHCLDVQKRAVTNGKQPFGACLVGPDNESVILTHGNVDHVNHAESSLARTAAAQFTQEYLWTCTLYSTWEPCAMCTATIYWTNIGRIVYAASNDQLMQLTGKGNPENFTMKWHCRDILEDSQKDIQILGPISGIDKVVMMESDIYWSQVRGKMNEKDYESSKLLPTMDLSYPHMDEDLARRIGPIDHFLNGTNRNG